MTAATSKILDFLELAFLRVAQLSLMLMMLSISADAIGRYVFNRPFQGNYEFTTLYLMVILTFLGMPSVYSSGGMVRLDVLKSFLSRLPWHLPERINSFAGAAVFFFMAWHAGHEAIDKFASGDKTFGLIQFPLYWSYIWVPLGSGLLAARLAFEFVMPSTSHSYGEKHFE